MQLNMNKGFFWKILVLLLKLLVCCFTFPLHGFLLLIFWNIACSQKSIKWQLHLLLFELFVGVVLLKRVKMQVYSTRHLESVWCYCVIYFLSWCRKTVAKRMISSFTNQISVKANSVVFWHYTCLLCYFEWNNICIRNFIFCKKQLAKYQNILSRFYQMRLYIW